MAITRINLDQIRQLLPSITTRPVHMIAMGYPDMLVTVEQVRELFSDDIAAALQFRADSEDIKAWHGLQGKIDAIIETKHFFSLIGIDIVFLDIKVVRGGEIVQDLNAPLHPSLVGRFDIVLDGGTLEHCLNIGQAIQNFLALAKVGGFICHSNPFNLPNHGFFNFNPTFYYDFYVGNGHALVSSILICNGDTLEQSVTIVPNTRRFEEKFPESVILAVAQRRHDRPAQWSLQTKYQS